MSNAPKPPPKYVKNDTLVDVVFELRFKTQPNIVASAIIPGVLLSSKSAHSELKSLKKLPASEIPQSIRNTQPNMAYELLIQVEYEGFIISIGDKSLTISCELPYPRWDGFKPFIVDTMKVLSQSNIPLIEQVERFSLRYANIIKSETLSDQRNSVKMNLSIGDNNLENDEIKTFHSRIETHSNDFISIFTIISSAIATHNTSGTKISGVLVDIDTIRNTPGMDFNNFITDIDNHLDKIHDVAKQNFFSCISDSALAKLEPVYE